METSLKTGFVQISLAAQKIRVAQNLGGGCSPPSPPGPYAYGSGNSIQFNSIQQFPETFPGNFHTICPALVTLSYKSYKPHI